MKSGKYVISFEVDLIGCESKEAALQAVRDVVENKIDRDELLEVNFEFIDGTDPDYTLEEDDEVEELNF